MPKLTSDADLFYTCPAGATAPSSLPELAVQGLEREVARMLAMAADCARGRIVAAPGPAAAPAVRVRTIMRLGQKVRGFVAQLNGRPLADTVAAALPHLLRAVQHAEMIAALAVRLDGAEAAPACSAVAADWAELRLQTLEALTQVMADEAGGAARAEAAYQAVKKGLLAAAAHGRTPVAALEQRPIESNRFAVRPVGHKLLQDMCFLEQEIRSDDSI